MTPLNTQYTYEPYGKTTNANAYQYTGRENDGTGLYFYRARYYSPTLQRFIAQDPGFRSNGRSLYLYSGSDPVDLKDPFGLLTSQLGGAINLQLGSWSVGLNVGFADDDAGNFGLYYQVSGSFGTGGGFGGSAGFSFGNSNGRTICDLAGPFANGTATGGDGLGGAFNLFAGGSADGPVLGSDVTVGAGFGAGASVGVSTTTVIPLFH